MADVPAVPPVLQRVPPALRAFRHEGWRFLHLLGAVEEDVVGRVQSVDRAVGVMGECVIVLDLAAAKVVRVLPVKTIAAAWRRRADVPTLNGTARVRWTVWFECTGAADVVFEEDEYPGQPTHPALHELVHTVAAVKHARYGLTVPVVHDDAIDFTAAAALRGRPGETHLASFFPYAVHAGVLFSMAYTPPEVGEAVALAARRGDAPPGFPVDSGAPSGPIESIIHDASLYPSRLVQDAWGGPGGGGGGGASTRGASPGRTMAWRPPGQAPFSNLLAASPRRGSVGGDVAPGLYTDPVAGTDVLVSGGLYTSARRSGSSDGSDTTCASSTGEWGPYERVRGRRLFEAMGVEYLGRRMQQLRHQGEGGHGHTPSHQQAAVNKVVAEATRPDPRPSQYHLAPASDPYHPSAHRRPYIDAASLPAHTPAWPHSSAVPTVQSVALQPHPSRHGLPSALPSYEMPGHPPSTYQSVGRSDPGVNTRDGPMISGVPRHESYSAIAHTQQTLPGGLQAPQGLEERLGSMLIQQQSLQSEVRRLSDALTGQTRKETIESKGSKEDRRRERRRSAAPSSRRASRRPTADRVERQLTRALSRPSGRQSAASPPSVSVSVAQMARSFDGLASPELDGRGVSPSRRMPPAAPPRSAVASGPVAPSAVRPSLPTDASAELQAEFWREYQDSYDKAVRAKGRHPRGGRRR